MNARNRHVLFSEHDRLKNDCANDRFCIQFPTTPFHLPHVAHSSETTHLFLHSQGEISLDRTGLAVFQNCPLQEDTVGFS